MIANTEVTAPAGIFPDLVKLLRKDLAVFLPRDRFLVGLVFILAHPMVFPSRESFFWLGISLAVGLSVYVPIIEWHQETDRMLSSLPIRRRTIVWARYCSSLLWIVFSAVAWLASGWLLGPVLAVTSETGFGASWATVPGLLTYLIYSVVVVSLFLPLYFHLGMGWALMVFVGLSLGTYGFTALRLGLFSPALRMEAALGGWIQGVGAGWVLFGALGLLGLIVGLSGEGSVRGFRRRDL